MRPARRIVVQILPEVANAVGKRFSAKEQEKLRSMYPHASWAELFAAAPGRTRKQINSWASYQGIARQTTLAQQRGGNRPAEVVAKAKPKPKPTRTSPPQPERSPATPVLNARVSARQKRAGVSPIGQMLEEMRKLLPSHPRRMAYALAARNGTGLDAYKAWKNWKGEAPASAD